MTIHEAHAWANNSDLIRDVFEIHVWPKNWGHKPDVMDVTFGKGKWWEWPWHSRVRNFTSHDIRLDGVDFRSLPEPDESMDVVAFDPDYVAIGGRKTSTVDDFNDRYGLVVKDYETPAALQALTINLGIEACARVLRPQGILLVKCATYISSGRPWLGEYHTIDHGLSIGLKVEDIFVHLSGTGPQPKRDGKQKHARSNSSRLIVFRKPGRRRKDATA